MGLRTENQRLRLDASTSSSTELQLQAHLASLQQEAAVLRRQHSGGLEQAQASQGANAQVQAQVASRQQELTRAAAIAAQEPSLAPPRTRRVRVRFHIIRNACIENVGKYQSCMVSKVRIIRKQTVVGALTSENLLRGSSNGWGATQRWWARGRREQRN